MVIPQGYTDKSLLIYGLLGVNLDYCSAVQVYLHIAEIFANIQRSKFW